MEKIKMPVPIAELDGDEMTHILWGMIKDQLIKPFVDLNTEYYDLSLPNRDRTKDAVTRQAAEAARPEMRNSAPHGPSPRRMRHGEPRPTPRPPIGGRWAARAAATPNSPGKNNAARHPGLLAGRGVRDLTYI